jgi:hypothetical protein
MNFELEHLALHPNHEKHKLNYNNHKQNFKLPNQYLDLDHDLEMKQRLECEKSWNTL